jgi:hypothetical protein
VLAVVFALHCQVHCVTRPFDKRSTTTGLVTKCSLKKLSLDGMLCPTTTNAQLALRTRVRPYKKRLGLRPDQKPQQQPIKQVIGRSTVDTSSLTSAPNALFRRRSSSARVISLPVRTHGTYRVKALRVVGFRKVGPWLFVPGLPLHKQLDSAK